MEERKINKTKIRKITIEENQDVYDLTVEKNHNFFANTLLVHNCVEQSLESYELCTLVETFPDNHESMEDYLRTLKFAYLYAKTVTLGKTHWPETNRVMLRNRRIGCSMSGLAQFVTHKGLHELKHWMTEGYKAIQHWDTVYSEWFAVPKSIKTTSCKPSGSVSLLVGATPGLHYPESRFYIRRMRLSVNSELVQPLKEAGYDVEPDVKDTKNTLVVSVPVDVGEGIRTLETVSMWEQLAMAAFVQKYWSDNQVSCTVTFQKHEADQIESALNFYQYQLKGISFLPKADEKVYPQMVYEKINEETYNKMLKKITKLSFGRIHGEFADTDKYCESDVCDIKAMREKMKREAK
jgi:adenosylcobalamin-dependent ribonucleoside-triphosphate reductase